MAKLSGSLLLMRAGVLPFATSSRESNPKAEDNHDYYLVDYGEKVPIKITSKPRGTRAGVFTFAYRGCVGAASAKIKVLRSANKDQLARDMASWLQKDAQGQPLIRLERTALKAATDHVEDLLQSYRATGHSGFGR